MSREEWRFRTRWGYRKEPENIDQIIDGMCKPFHDHGSGAFERVNAELDKTQDVLKAFMKHFLLNSFEDEAVIEFMNQHGYDKIAE